MSDRPGWLLFSDFPNIPRTQVAEILLIQLPETGLGGKLFGLILSDSIPEGARFLRQFLDRPAGTPTPFNQLVDSLRNVVCIGG